MPVAVLLLAIAVPSTLAEEATEENDDSAVADASGISEYIEVRVPYAPTSNTIASKLPLSLQLTPSNVGSVAAALMREQQANVLSDVLQNISGLNIQSGSGVHDYFVIRGFNSLDGGLILTDGAPEPEVTLYPTYNVEGVEVLKGPAGFLYGSNPLAGAVNLVRKQPLPGDFVNFGLSGGSFGTYEANVDWNTSNDPGSRAVRVNAFWRESDNYRDDKDSTHFAVNPSITWRFGDDAKLNLNLEVVEAEFNPDAGIPLLDTDLDGLNDQIAEVPRDRSYQSPVDFSEQSIYRFQADFEKRLNDRVTLRNKFYHRDLDWDTAGTLLVGVNPLAPTLALRTLNVLDDHQQFTGNQFEAVLELGGGVTHNMLVGIELARFADEFTIDLVPPPSGFPGVPAINPIDIFDPVETYTAINGTIPFSAGDAESIVIAPYVVDQIKFNDKVQLMLGVRFDQIDFSDNLDAASDRDEGELSPMAGLVIAPTSSFSIYANAGESFAPGSPRVTGEVLPEESRQFELGVKKRFLDGQMRTTFAVYQLERENIAISDDNGFTQQQGDQRSRGFEFELAAEPVPLLRTFFSYSYIDAELTNFAEKIIFGPGPNDFFVVDRTGNTPAFVPEHLANLWISKSFRSGFGFGGGARYVGEQFIAEDNGFELDDYTVLNAAVFYDRSAWRFKLNFKNITDEDYNTRGFGSASVIPADPFSVFASVEFRR